MLAAGARATSSKLWRASEVLPGSDPFVGLTRARCSRPGALAWWRVCSNQVRPFGRRSGLLLGSFRRASFPCPMRARTGVGLIYHRGRARAADDDSGWWLLRRGAARPKCGVVRPGRGRRLPQRWEEAVAGGPKAPKQNVLCTNTAPGGDADATPRERENRRFAGTQTMLLRQGAGTQTALPRSHTSPSSLTHGFGDRAQQRQMLLAEQQRMPLYRALHRPAGTESHGAVQEARLLTRFELHES